MLQPVSQPPRGLEGQSILLDTLAQPGDIDFHDGIADIRAGPYGSDPRAFASTGTYACLIANDGVHGDEIWCSDGTESGTIRVSDVVSGPVGARASGLTAADGVAPSACCLTT